MELAFEIRKRLTRLSSLKFLNFARYFFRIPRIKSLYDATGVFLETYSGWHRILKKKLKI